MGLPRLLLLRRRQQNHATIIISINETTTLLLSLLLVYSLQIPLAAAQPIVDPEESLLKLRASLENATTSLSSWNRTTRPCFGLKNNWDGIICSQGGSVYGIKLDNMGLSGKIDLDALMDLHRLRTISFEQNNFDGPFPEIKKLKTLKHLYLSNNKFTGDIDPQAFEGLNRIRKVHLANNRFTGEIPISLTKLPFLVELRLEGNEFEGPIPDFPLNSFHDFSLANNQLEGPIPLSLSRLNKEAFVGNNEVCGMPVNSCSPSPPPPPEKKNDTNVPTPIIHTPTTPPEAKKPAPIVHSVIAAVVIILVVLIVIFVILYKKRNQESDEDDPYLQDDGLVAGTRNMTENGDDDTPKGAAAGRSKDNSGKLCFVREGGERFDLPDLLKASAEILGSGCFGSSYKANLTSGSMMVVKRFKQMNNVGRDEFQEHMRRLGRIDHPNLLPVVAYYYRKEEKLLVYSFVQRGSLASHLHAHARGEPTMNWPTRLKIIKGVASGMSHLYTKLPSLISPHGHLKSSNVLIDESYNPILNDYGLIPLINQESAHALMVAYKAPEHVTNARINKKTDVWCLGILIIETLTGEFPATNLQGGSEVDLTDWIKAVTGDGNTTVDVFDKNMTMTRNSEGEMRKMLKIGLACCEADVDKRLDINEACDRIEEIKEKDNDDDFYSSYEGDKRSSRGMSADFSVVVD